MKVIHIGDQHLGGAYPEKAAKSFDFLNSELWENDSSPAFAPDLIVSTGDLTDRPLHVHSEYLRPFLEFVQRSRCPIVLLQGTPSHEPIGAIQNIGAVAQDQLMIISDPQVSWLKVIRGMQIQIMGLPALTKPLLKQWLQMLGIDIDPFEFPSEAIREILLHIFGCWSTSSGVKLLLGHWTVSGCVTPSGQELVGTDLEVGLDDLALSGADAVLLGHIHKAQEWPEPIFTSYCGSSHPCNWGELDEKSFSVLDFDVNSGALENFGRVLFPHKGMVKVELQFSGESNDGIWDFKTADDIMWDRTGRSQLQSKEVKCCYTIPREIAVSVDDAYIRLMFAKEGIELAAVERTIASQSRERIIDISSKETTRAQYEVTCQARNEEPRPGALEKADRIDEQGVTA